MQRQAQVTDERISPRQHRYDEGRVEVDWWRWQTILRHPAHSLSRGERNYVRQVRVYDYHSHQYRFYLYSEQIQNSYPLMHNVDENR